MDVALGAECDFTLWIRNQLFFYSLELEVCQASYMMYHLTLQVTWFFGTCNSTVVMCTHRWIWVFVATRTNVNKCNLTVIFSVIW